MAGNGDTGGFYLTGGYPVGAHRLQPDFPKFDLIPGRGSAPALAAAHFSVFGSFGLQHGM
jgi:hypothetical protein